MCIGLLHVKYRLLLWDFNETWIFSADQVVQCNIIFNINTAVVKANILLLVPDALKIIWSIVSNLIHSQIKSCLQSAPSGYSVFGTNDGVTSDISEHEQAASSSSTSTNRFRRRFDQFHFRSRFIQSWQRNNGLLLVLHLVVNMLAEICEGEGRTRVLLNYNDSQR